MAYHLPLIILSALYTRALCTVYQYGNTNGGYASYTTNRPLYNQNDYKSGYGSELGSYGIAGSYGSGTSRYPNYSPSGYTTRGYTNYNTAGQGLYSSSTYNGYSTPRYGEGYNSYSTVPSYGTNSGSGYGVNSIYGTGSTYGSNSLYGAGSTYGTGSAYGTGVYGTRSTYGSGSYGAGSGYGTVSTYGSGSYGTGLGYGSGSSYGNNYGATNYGAGTNYGTGSSYGAGSNYGTGSSYGSGTNYGIGSSYGAGTNYGTGSNYGGSNYGGSNYGAGIGAGVGGYGSYGSGYMTGGEYCVNRSPVSDVLVESLYGMWYGVEVIDHLGGPRNYDYYESWRSCIVVQISEPRDQPFSTETPLIHAQQLIGKFKKEHRILRLLWDENGSTSEYSFYFRNDSIGYWQVYVKQNGSLAERNGYKQFGGSVQILSAANDNLVLHFCESAKLDHPAQMYTILLSREPAQIADWERDAVHNMLQNKRLSIASRRLVCGNSRGFRTRFSILMSLLTCTLAYVLGK